MELEKTDEEIEREYKEEIDKTNEKYKKIVIHRHINELEKWITEEKEGYIKTINNCEEEFCVEAVKHHLESVKDEYIANSLNDRKKTKTEQKEIDSLREKRMGIIKLIADISAYKTIEYLEIIGDKYNSKRSELIGADETDKQRIADLIEELNYNRLIYGSLIHEIKNYFMPLITFTNQSFIYIQNGKLPAKIDNIFAKTIKPFEECIKAYKTIADDYKEQIDISGMLEELPLFSEFKRESDGNRTIYRSDCDNIILICDNDMPKMIANPELMKIVASNFGGNSIKYGIKENEELRMEFTFDSEKNEFCYSDNGKGIDPYAFPNPNDIFERGKTTEGTGFGLYFTKLILDKYKPRGSKDNVRVETDSTGTRIYFSIDRKYLAE